MPAGPVHTVASRGSHKGDTGVANPGNGRPADIITVGPVIEEAPPEELPEEPDRVTGRGAGNSGIIEQVFA